MISKLSLAVAASLFERECCGTLPGSQHRITCPKSRHRNKIPKPPEEYTHYVVSWDEPDTTHVNAYRSWRDAAAQLKKSLDAGYRVDVRKSS